MENKSTVVFVLGVALVVVAAGRGVGWNNLWLDLSTAPSGWQDAQRRVKLLSPYFGVMGGVIVATFASSLSDEVGDFFLGTEALILLLIAVMRPLGVEDAASKAVDNLSGQKDVAVRGSGNG